MMKKGWVPPRSPFGLIQEDMWPNEWAILVACVMLNCTARRQVERVIPEFLRRWPSPDDLLTANRDDVVAVVAPLGFGNRRADNLIKLASRFIRGDWSDARELPSVGEYAGRAHDIFCRGVIGTFPPNDHALTDYWRWLQAQHPELIKDEAATASSSEPILAAAS